MKWKAVDWTGNNGKVKPMSNHDLIFQNIDKIYQAGTAAECTGCCLNKKQQIPPDLLFFLCI